MPRKTTAKEIVFEGRGLHGGGFSRITLIPSARASGIRFIKKTGPKKSVVPAKIHNVSQAERGTNLGEGRAAVKTVEHLLSALAAFSIDDLDVETEGDEIPAMDGSAVEFASALAKVGIAVKKKQAKNFLTLKKEFLYAGGNSLYRASPCERLEFKIWYLNPHPLIGKQSFCYNENTDYLKEVAPARTFAFEREIGALLAEGLAKGGALDNAVVITRNGFLSSEKRLRFENEFARHKLLDFMGDLKLLGAALCGVCVEAFSTGHASNLKFADVLLKKGIPLGGDYD